MIGVGPIGALAQRLAVAAGGACVAAVGRSSSKRAVALAGGARRFLRSDEEEAEIAQLAVSLVIEATGNPHAIPLAIRAAGTNGRIVLLGSHGAPRRGCPSRRSEFAVCACWARTSTPCEARCARAEPTRIASLRTSFSARSPTARSAWTICWVRRRTRARQTCSTAVSRRTPTSSAPTSTGRVCPSPKRSVARTCGGRRT